MGKLYILSDKLKTPEDKERVLKFSKEYTLYLDSLPSHLFTDNNTIELVSLMNRDITDAYGNEYYLNEQYLINESINTKTVSTVQSIIDHISYLYKIPKELFLVDIPNHIENINYKILPSYWKCPVSLSVPAIRGNLNIIQLEMKQFGYYMIARKDRHDNDGKLWYEIIFNPIHQESIREMLENKIIYHLSPNVYDEDIEEFGIIPQDGKRTFKYKHRSFFFLEEAFDDNYFKKMIRSMTEKKMEQLPEWDGDYTLYLIRVKKLSKDIDFFWDSNMKYGVWTNKIIPFNSIIEIEYNYNVEY